MNKNLLISVIAVVFFCLVGSAGFVSAQGGTGKTTTPVTKPKTPVKTTTKTTKTIKKKSKKTPDPPIADWEMTNLIGHWEGTYDGAKSTLEIERILGDEFFGYFTTSGGLKIAYAGRVVRAERKIIFAETDVLDRTDDYQVWSMGINTGTLKYGGFDMKGTGKKDADGTVYTWSYIQILL